MCDIRSFWHTCQNRENVQIPTMLEYVTQWHTKYKPLERSIFQPKLRCININFFEYFLEPTKNKKKLSAERISLDFHHHRF